MAYLKTPNKLQNRLKQSPNSLCGAFIYPPPYHISYQHIFIQTYTTQMKKIRTVFCKRNVFLLTGSSGHFDLCYMSLDFESN